MPAVGLDAGPLCAPNRYTRPQQTLAMCSIQILFFISRRRHQIQSQIQVRMSRRIAMVLKSSVAACQSSKT